MTSEQKRWLLQKLLSGELLVASNKELASAPLRLCSDKRMNPEAIEGLCEMCKAVIFYDHGYPDGPEKICMDCALGRLSH